MVPALPPLWASLGFKVISSLVVVWLALLVGLHVVLRASVQTSFAAIERRLALEDMWRIRGAFAQDLVALEQAARDYAIWDEMLGYVQHPTPDFVQANLADTMFGTLRIDLAQVYDAQQRPVFAKAQDPTSGQPHHFAEVEPEQLLRSCPILAPIKPDTTSESLRRSGICRNQDRQLMEVAAHPILKSDGRGRAAGAVVFARLIDRKMLDALQEQLKLHFEIETAGVLEPAATDHSPLLVNDRVTVTTLWRDPFERPIARMHLSRRAAIYEQGRHALAIAATGALVVLTIVLIVLWIILKLTVVLPLKRLGGTISTIQENGGVETRVMSARRDEIGLLAQNFERLLILLRERANALEQMATSDELTELFNRRFIMDLLHREVERAVRYDQELAILLLDIDYFKRINDTLGHAVGDRVLRGIGRILKETTRASDGVGRYGGEEFLIVMPHQTQAGAQVVAERVRKTIESSTAFGTPWPVTVSIGVACWEGHTREALLYVADKNLYRAKASGRNSTVALTIPLDCIPRPSITSIRVRSRAPSASS
ncbi:MAG: diguanylate cyclase [Myxococcales bacterium]